MFWYLERDERKSKERLYTSVGSSVVIPVEGRD